MSTKDKIKGKDLGVFVRFGGVNLKPQYGYTTKNPTFHSPPTNRGIYAMPKVAQEFFLIGSIGNYQKGTMPKAPKYPGSDASPEALAKWEEIRDKFDWDAFNRRCSDNRSAMRKEFEKRDGNIWHHLGEYCNVAEIIGRHGSWVKTSVKEWMRAFGKMSMEHRYGQRSGGWDFSVKSINEARGILGCYSKDHCEVFFDEKI